MLYVSVDDMVPADDFVSAGSDTSALLPSELIQHLDTYEGSLGESHTYIPYHTTSLLTSESCQ